MASEAPISDPHPREEDIRRFVEAWGRMGSVWGISRTMAEVHALLYITGEPLCADDIMDRLAISRGNASMSLRGLLDWGIVSRAHRRGDRKDYFVAEQDVWAIFRAIVRERKKREVDPLLASLHELRDHTREAQRESGRSGKADDIDGRLDEMLEFFEMASTLAERFIGPSGPGLRFAATMLSKAPLPGGPKRGARGGARKAAQRSGRVAEDGA
ncbi:MAG: transcriptional regulator [Phycisphaerae bacterium]|nr:transcriptional regulator [Phycisphaerae bacterium]